MRLQPPSAATQRCDYNRPAARGRQTAAQGERPGLSRAASTEPRRGERNSAPKRRRQPTTINSTNMHLLTLGNFELTALSDGIFHLDGGGLFGVVPKVVWSRKVQAEADNRVPPGLNCVLGPGHKTG